MDNGAYTTQRIVIAIAIILGFIIVFSIGYSLYVKAKRAEGELATKIALDNETTKKTDAANISLTGEAKNSAAFSYDGLIQKKEDTSSSTKFEIVNETAPVEVPPEEIIPEEEAVPPEEIEEVIEPVKKPVVVQQPTQNYDEDRPLTAAEIRAIRELPVDDSPSGNLQTSLEEESQGQYKARY